jgi:hypothetical protein
MNTKYRVYSGDDDNKVLEVTRTDERVARNDVEIFRQIIGRTAWVEEVQS